MCFQHINQIDKNNDHQGFTLIEVLISMMVLSIGILAIGLMHISAINGNAKALEITETYAAILDQYEALLATPYDNIAVTDPEAGPDVKIMGDYTITTEITEPCVEDTEGNCKKDLSGNDILVGTKDIKVTISWANSDGTTQEFIMNQILARVNS